ncbi:Bug family tripartite tricarboxylate transporter substrate binding protein [Rhodoplanes sp. Z2-YC6860]|uniref:Bug family tripartite tricarboxylate transporter substrate binding protein n=1 Tax=Rhodoplanes sp. Z2-YC6860 TaxID=674703 RepID=UPI00078CD2D3|nr:tripartite tricarboxylate transporter substrate binding protein [Rhodoplanes sp. Z2-YC6860]AMN44952.1 extra-cytoplasmic solute receptor protein [Rhodoplanes sp. Z2-YC6860]
MKLVIGAAFAALACLSFAGHDAHAQSWPSRPIKVIVPTGAGAATDVMARLMADSVQHGLGQPVVVENQAGASGLIAHQNAARSAPDGYTFLFTNTSGLATNPVSFQSLPYNPARDFTPVAMIVDFGPQILSVNAEVPVKSLPELIAYAKANPGKLSYAVDVTAGAAPIIARLFNKRAALGLVEVPYRSASQMVQDVASGVVPVLMSSMAASNGMVQAGKIRRLAISSSQRFPPLPELPAINETVPGVTMDGWFVLVGPAGLPADIVQRMNREVGEFLKGDAIKQRLAGFGLATSGAGTPQSTGEFIAREQEKWRALAQELNIEPQ